jgi:hypothetical protein
MHKTNLNSERKVAIWVRIFGLFTAVIVGIISYIADQNIYFLIGVPMIAGFLSIIILYWLMEPSVNIIKINDKKKKLSKK